VTVSLKIQLLPFFCGAGSCSCDLSVICVNERFTVLCSKLAYVCFALETSKNQYVMYQAAATLRDSLIREWLTLDRQDIESLRVYLMHFVIEKTE
jgi:hypothetical protein